MADIIDITDKLSKERTDYLVLMARKYDFINKDLIKKGIDIVEISGIMANRVGELVRIYDGDKEALKGMIYNIIHDRTYLGE